MTKPGYRTSEFWFTLVSFLFSGLYLIGIIGDVSQKEDLIRDVSHGVESIILIGGQLMILYKYISSRAEVKQKDMLLIENDKVVDSSTIDKSAKKTGVKNDRSKRVSKSRSRKTNKPS